MYIFSLCTYISWLSCSCWLKNRTFGEHKRRMREKMYRWWHQILIFMIFRLNWRRLFLSGVIITTAGILLLLSSLPYPLTLWDLSPSLTYLAHEPLDRNTALIYNTAVRANDRLATSNVGTRIVLPKNVAELNQSRIVVDGESNLTNTSDETTETKEKRYTESLKPDEALLYAKKEIEKASMVTDDPDLHAPLFHNVSSFKRSYELMELILKVYIYGEGRRPIFHQPYLRGIYASEGWFMRLLKGNKKLVTSDPEKAHLFYLPYSARQLARALYVPNSHNLKPLSIFLRDYVNMLAAKYPFWNRSHGSDHFLAGCHDWGSYTLTEHKELKEHSIKALCNADSSEGIFIAGKDVSLPETTIRNPNNPHRNLGGKRVSQRHILAFFAGKMHGRVRPILRKTWSGKDNDMRIYGALPRKVSQTLTYAQHMKSSKFCLCPMGYEVNSPRIVEAIYYECVPVIIADNFVLPLSDVLNWSSFSVVVGEKDIPKLKEILLAITLRQYQKMQTNVRMLQKHFLWNPVPLKYDMFHMILHSIWASRLNQIQMPESS
ncbi:putative glycosyltransferase At5g03795 isoform X1 [Apium graveolens]|uniref:putative glycosyltransferase At5g03795 isoform X1 n=3 Tax=Apium graveolens TaxID=4045 RepID=UPI003D7A6818